MIYPNYTEYTEQIEGALEKYAHLKLVRKADNTPVYSTGGFGLVFKMQDPDTKKYYAVKCFARTIENISNNYYSIENYIKKYPNAYLIPIEFLDKEVFIDSSLTKENYFPALVMEWCEGLTLQAAIKEICTSSSPNPEALIRLAHSFRDLALWLLEQPIAHSDLKPDNILVDSNGCMRLVDYDGMFVPAMEGKARRITGTNAYIHPLRHQQDFDRHDDDFAILVIFLSLCLLINDPTLYKDFNNDQNIIFSQEDFESYHTPLWNRLHTDFIHSPISAWLMLLKETILHPQAEIKTLPHLLRQTDIEDCSEQYNNLTRVEKNGEYEFVDRTGKIVIPLEYGYVDLLSKGLARIRKNWVWGGWGFVDKAGKIVIPLEYDEVPYSFNELARVKKNGKWGFVDKAGKIVIPLEYDWVDSFSEGLAWVKKNEKHGFVDKTGKIVIPLEYDWAGSFREGLARVKKNEKRGFVDRAGKIVIPLEYDGADSFSEGLAMVKKSDKWGFVDKTGKIVLPLEYEEIGKFSEGLVWVKKNEKYGFVDKTGKIVISLIYDKVDDFCDIDGIARVERNGLKMVVNRIGNEYIIEDIRK